MSVERYQACLGFLNLLANELEWFPRWLKAYAEFPSVVAARGTSNDCKVTRELVIEYLQSLRDRKIEAWRRLQAARAIEIYQGDSLVGPEHRRRSLSKANGGLICSRPSPGVTRVLCPE